MADSVNDPIQVTDEQIREADELWTDPQTILNLIDLMFLDEDPSKVIYS